MLATTHGYHPLVGDASDMLATGLFDEVLVLGPDLPDPAGSVERVGQVIEPAVELPEGVYWFSGLDSAPMLVVTRGGVPSAGLQEPSGEVPEGSALALALGWFEHLWECATEVRLPRFAAFDEVITRAGQDATIRSRRYSQGHWMYQVSAGGRILHVDEDSLDERPTVDAPVAWVLGEPAPAERFAATLTRAKLEKRFTDTVSASGRPARFSGPTSSSRC